jgi:hypothetical protein
MSYTADKSATYEYNTILTLVFKNGQFSPLIILYSLLGIIYHQVYNSKNSTFCPKSVFMCFLCFSEQKAVTSLHNINWLVFITETEFVHCTVQTYKIQANLSVYSVTGTFKLTPFSFAKSPCQRNQYKDFHEINISATIRGNVIFGKIKWNKTHFSWKSTCFSARISIATCT